MVAVLQPRSRKEVQAEIKKMRNFWEKTLRSKKAAFDFLYKGGFITRTGKLAKRYRSD